MSTTISGEIAGKKVSKENPLLITNVPFFTQITDNSSSTVTYFGYALPGSETSQAKWVIVRQLIAGSVITLAFAGASRDFDQIWDKRTSLTYS